MRFLKTVDAVVINFRYCPRFSGIILGIIAILLAVRAIKSKPEEIGLIERLCFLLAIIFSITFPIVGLVIALYEPSQPITVSSVTSIENLRTNKRVQYCLRLVPYSSFTRPAFERLGPPGQMYTFVADYPELQGHTAADAVDMVGGSVPQMSHVFAVIFSRNDYPLFPANARGLLQVVKAIDNANRSTKNYCSFNVSERISRRDEQTDLRQDKIPTWAWDSYKGYFADYCNKAIDFITFSTDSSDRARMQCGPTDSTKTAQDYLGNINGDWNLLGFSEKEKTTVDRSDCNISSDLDWNNTLSGLRSRFGARAFLIENVKISDLQGRNLVALIDYRPVGR